MTIDVDDLLYIHSAESQSRQSVLVTLCRHQGIVKLFFKITFFIWK